MPTARTPPHTAAPSPPLRSLMNPKGHGVAHPPLCLCNLEKISSIMSSNPHLNNDDSNNASTAADATDDAAAPEPANAPAAAESDDGMNEEGAPDPEPEPEPSALPAFHGHLLGRLMTALADSTSTIVAAKEDMQRGEQLVLEGRRLIRQGNRAKLEAERDRAVADRKFGTASGWIVHCGNGQPPRFVRPELRNAGIRQLARGGGGGAASSKMLLALSTSGQFHASRDEEMEAMVPWHAPEDSGAIQVAAGRGFELCLSAQGQVYVWSDDDDGAPNVSPVRIPIFDEDDAAVEMYAGPSSDAWMVRTQNGHLCKIGTSAGTVAVGTGPDFRTPGTAALDLGSAAGPVYVQTLIPRFAVSAGPSRAVLSAAAGHDFVVVVARDSNGDGVVYTAGCNQHGQLGRDAHEQRDVELKAVR
jgi:Regulator of chromosome condensation (RCC1) repeat